jgi:hypothetical protein
LKETLKTGSKYLLRGFLGHIFEKAQGIVLRRFNICFYKKGLE